MRPSPPRLSPRTAWVLAAAVLATGCPEDPRASRAREVVATVGEVPIERRDFLAELTWAGVARSRDEEARHLVSRAVLDRMVETELLLLGAIDANIEVSDEDVEREYNRTLEAYPVGAFSRVMRGEQLTEDSFRERLRTRIHIERFLQKAVGERVEVSRHDTQTFFENNRAPVPERVWVRQILLKTEEEARHILGEIRAGRLTVEDAARRFSHAPEAADGGSLGWFAKGDLPTVFDTAFDLEVGQVSEVVPSDFGFHVFELVERRPGGIETFDQAEPRLTRALREERERDAMMALIRRLRSQHAVVIDDVAVTQAVNRLPPPPPLPVADEQVKVVAP